MKEYKILITEYLTKEITINAQSEDEAYNKAKELYNNEDIVLDYNNITQTEIEVLKGA